MKNLEVRRFLKKAISIGLTISMVGCMTACGAKEPAQSTVITEENKGDVLATALSQQVSSEGNAEKAGKEETVYVMADAAGTVNEVIVSDWLKNPDKAEVLTDATDLADVKNVKGYEDYTQGEDGTLTWNAEGSDIYYQGTSKKELPVNVKVSYKLDGKEISPEELAGKSGKVTIRFDYENNAMETAKIGDKDEEITVPFAMISGMILSDEKFHNIEISNGRVISEGNNSIVVGVAFPGLRESLDIDEIKENLESEEEKEKADEIHIPDYVEVTADATDFALDMTMTMAMSDVLDSVNLTDSIDLTEMNDSMDELQDGSNQLKDGTTELKDGTEELVEGTYDLKDGTSELVDGVDELKDGTTELRNGTNDLKNGTAKLKDGADELNHKSAELDSGAKKLNDGASDLKKGSEDLKGGTEKLSKGTGDLKTGAAQLKEGVTKLKAMLGSGLNSVGTGIDSIMDGFTRENGLLAGAQQLEDTTAQFDTLLNEYLTRQVYKNAVAGGKINALIQTLEAAQKDAAKNQAAAEAALQSAEAERDRAKAAIDATYNASEIEVTSSTKVLVATALDGEYETKTSTQTIMGTDAAAVQSAVDAYTKAQEKVAQLKEEAAGAEAVVKTLSENRAELEQSLAYLNGKAGIGANSDEISDTSYIVVLKQASRGIASGAKALNTGINEVYKGISSLAQGMTGMSAALNDEKEGLPALVNGADRLAQGASDADDGAKLLDAGTQKLKKGSDTLKDGTAELKKGTSKLIDGTEKIKNGAVDLDDGAGKLQKGAIELDDGVVELKDGAHQLDDGASDLKDGAEKLDDGAGELKDGMFEFDEEGIEKLTSILGDDVQDVIDRLDAVRAAGKEYNTFTKLADGTDGKVKFIYKTDSIK